MAWIFSTMVGEKYREGVEINPEDRAAVATYSRELASYHLKEFNDFGWGRGRGGLTTFGHAFDLPDWPIRFTATGTPNPDQKLPNFTNTPVGWLISQEVIDLIEKHEPGVHKYWPTQISWKDGSPYHEKLWVLVIQNRISSLKKWVSFKKQLSHSRFREPSYQWLKNNPADLALNKSVIDGRAIWTEENSQPNFRELCVSDAFAEQLSLIDTGGLRLDLRVQES